MASLSLPRVLQLKKNSLDAEREQFEKFQTLAIQKAINAIETPVKEKHVRSTIIGTFQEQSAVTYWMVAIRLPIQDNRIVAWKFCHVTHKLLREGHPACLDDSQRHIGMIENLGKLWVHLREGYGKLVHLYCNLLVCKLKFHSRNPRFPGNMQLTADELDAIAENDVNNYFQLCVELFDYMEEILNLQASVFDSLGNARANSMTASGQCRLAALIPCAQDASQIYDCNVRLLFRLHASLPPDTLTGHRERFRQQFKKLSSFYKHASSLQYYRNLLTLPVLPSNPPNFLLQSDFGTYVTPVVSIPEPPPDEADSVGSLIDTSDTMSQATLDQIEEMERPSPSPQSDPIVERDRLIDHLQHELKRMRSEVSQHLEEKDVMLSSMKVHCTRLESQLHTATTELEEEKQRAKILSQLTPEIKKKLTETEEKARVQDEKFQKLKGAYTQLREEHITLIRQKAEVDKLSANLRAFAAQQESAKLALQQQLNDRMKDVELLQQSASSSEEIEAYKTEISSLRNDLEVARQKECELENVRASMEALEIDYKTAVKEQEDKLTTVTNELKETTETLEMTKREKDEKESELARVREELIGLKEKSGDKYKKAVQEKEAALSQVAEWKQQYLQEKEELSHLNNHINELKSETDNLKDSITILKSDHAAECQKLNQELSKHREDSEILLSDTEVKLNNSLEKLESLEKELQSKVTAVSQLEEQVEKYKKSLTESEAQSLEERKALLEQLHLEVEQKNELQKNIDEHLEHISQLEYKLTNFQQMSMRETESNQNLTQRIDEQIKEIGTLKNFINEQEKLYERKNSKIEIMNEIISVLTSDIGDKSKEIIKLTQKLNDTSSNLEMQAIDSEVHLRELYLESEKLKSDLESVTKEKDNKENIISNLEAILASKEIEISSKNEELEQLRVEITELEEILTETQAELEIASDELIDLKEEHEKIIKINDDNLIIKNSELSELDAQIKEFSILKGEFETQIKKLQEDMLHVSSEKQVLENEYADLKQLYENLNTAHYKLKYENESLTMQLNHEIDNLKMDYKHLNIDKENEVMMLNDKIKSLESFYNEEIEMKNKVFIETDQNLKVMREELENLQQLVSKERADALVEMAEKDRDMQILENRLEHVETKRLNAECELQDLLQHNTVLEADLAAIKKQLEDTQKALQKQTSLLVNCAGEAAVEVTNEAISAFEQANAQDTITHAAEQAAKALEQLAMHTNVSGSEELVAKSSIFVAHNAAQLSVYVTDVSSVSTDMEVADKLNNECRTMLTATKKCLESVKSGNMTSSSCIEAKSLLRAMMTSAAAADRNSSGARSVDDELADMDRAIEEAASQIESMLAATRAADSGVKLEVNGKILDACTTLMSAVKILVQDARKLQLELGDTKTRQKMYRKNPQWSEGLISAGKAVVFAAKLLVTSADEAVGASGASGASGQAEGVSAAAHEVAGSTAQLVAASRARAPPDSPALARLTHASRSVAAATGALVAAVKAGSTLALDQEALDTSSLSLTATRRLEMESKVRSLKLETALDAERARLAALRKRHYQLAQMEENGNIENSKY